MASFLDLGGKHTGIPGNLAQIFDLPVEEAEKIWKENKVKLLTGQETPKEFLAFMNISLGKTIDVDEAFEKWKTYNKIEKEKIDWELVSYIEQLKKHYKIHILTDTIDIDNGAGTWIGDITKHVANIFKSYEQKLRKPDHAAYLNVLRQINARPEECLFIDDFPANIKASEEVGMKGFLYSSVAQLKKDFRAAGIVA